MNTTKNFANGLKAILSRLFSKKGNSATNDTNKPKSEGITIIPNDLNEIKNPKFTNFDKIKFYKQLKSIFPKNADNIYRIMALETSHFKSGQFIYTGTGGMEAHKEAFPYGWTSALTLWKNKELKPTGYKVFTDSAKRKRAFLGFNTPLAFAAYLNEYLNKYSVGRWRSTEPAKMASYEAYIKKINLPTIV